MKKFLLLFSIIAVIFSLMYSSYSDFNGNDSALSKIGLKHPVLFVIWGILIYLALYFNIIYGFNRINQNKWYISAIISFIGIVLTISFKFDYSIYWQYLMHCFGSLMFSFVTGITVLFLFIKSKRYLLSYITSFILISDLILLLIFKETAIIELLPIISGIIMLNINNYLKVRNNATIER